MVSKFNSREHLLECLVASCLAPGWAGYRGRTINGRKYVDGGLSVNLPDICPGETLRIQPFSTCKTLAEITPLLTNPSDEGKLIAKIGIG